MKFTEAEIPTTTRKATENPFLDAVKSLVGTNKALKVAGLPVDVKGPDVDGKPDDNVGRTIGRIRRQLTEAGNPHNVTVRNEVVPTDTDGVTTLSIKFWTVAKIKRAEKPAEASPEATGAPETN